MNTNSILRDTNSYLEKVFKDESIRTHSFRCAFIKELLDDNVNVKLIQELTGHKSASSIYRYIQNRNIDLSSILNSIR
jgi:site-specific recombinase XerD